MRTCIAIVLLIAVAASAETIVLQPGPEGIDTYIDGSHPGTNYGGSDSLYVGITDFTGRTLIKWDLSGIPEGAEIESATMELFCYEIDGEQPCPFKLYPVTESWIEDEVTWDSRPDYDNGRWVDVETAYIGAYANSDITEFVNDWLSDEANYGLVVRSEQIWYMIKFRSSDYDYDGNRPKLTIEYTPSDTGIKPSSFGAIKAVYR